MKNHCMYDSKSLSTMPYLTYLYRGQICQRDSPEISFCTEGRNTHRQIHLIYATLQVPDGRLQCRLSYL